MGRYWWRIGLRRYRVDYRWEYLADIGYALIERREEYDPARLLTWAALALVSALIFFVGLMITFQIYKNGEANTEAWASLTGLIGWVTGTVSMIYNSRYGTSKQAETKDAVIAQQSRTAATLAGVSGGTQTAPAETVNVTGENVNVTEKEKP